MRPMFIAALFTVTRAWEQSTCPSTNRWIKTWHVYRTEYSSAVKKKEIRPSAATWMGLESVILSALSQRRDIIWHPLYVDSKKGNKWASKQRETPRLSKWTHGRPGEGIGEGIVKDVGKVMCTLLYLKWITNKDLLWDTGNSAQCSAAAWMGQGSGGEWIHLDVDESLHRSPGTSTTLFIG